MKIVVIDDEPVIGSGIAKLVENINPEWIVCGIYNDAQEALELCNWDEVQVALTDISMPHIDGLKMLSILREHGYKVYVIFITAYAKFEYAKAAVQNQALDYLLKPIIRRDLEAALIKADNQWKHQMERESDTAYIMENLGQLRKYFLSDLIFEERPISPQEIEKNLQRYHLADKRFTLMVLYSTEEYNTIKSRLQDIFSPAKELDWFLYGQPPFYVLLLIMGGKMQDIYFGSVQNNCQAACRSENIASLESLANQYHQLLVQLRHSIKVADYTVIDSVEDPLARKNFAVSINQAIDFIQNNYMKKLTLKNISEQVYLHPTYLSNIFKKQTGYTIVDYINYYRVIQAKRMLMDPNNKIYWVTEKVGFVNERYFSEVFKKITNMTPTQYKQNSYFNSRFESRKKENG